MTDDEYARYSPWRQQMVAADAAISEDEQHIYPSSYRPGTHWAVDAAWEILDTIKPGIISDDARAFLAGQIAGRLIRERDYPR